MIRTFALVLPILLAFAMTGCGGDSADVESPTPAAADGEPTFGDVKLATEIDAVSKAPITEVTSFPSDAEAMHAAIQVRNVRAGSRFQFRWTKGAEQAALIEVNVSADTAEDWVGASVFPNGPVPAGDDWLLAVFFNGTTIASAQFSVRPAE